MEKSFIILRTYSFAHQADMDLNALKNEGLEAYISDANMGSFSFLGAATGGVRLHVADKDTERAQEVLSDQPSPNT